MFLEILLPLLVLLLVLGIPIAGLVVGLVALAKTKRIRTLMRRVEQLEAVVRGLAGPAAQAQLGPEPVEQPIDAELVPDEMAAHPEPAASPFGGPGEAAPAAREPIQWEVLIGRKALGWVAVGLLIVAAAFFLKYAYDNHWIGPQGQVAAAVLAGAALMVAGWRHYRRGWRIFSQMLSAAGVVVLYLSAYSAFGYYHLMSQEAAGLFLAAIVIESVLLALRYDSLAIALTAILGGLATPVLMQSDHDLYRQLFIYLAVLDLGVVLVLLARAWYAVGTVGLVGTQWLFWLWYGGNYHPEKLPWAIGFQAVVFVLFLGHTVAFHLVRGRRGTWEDALRVVLNAAFWFMAIYALLNPDYGPWMGTAAVGVAAVYAILARLLLACRPEDKRQLVAALAVAVGMIALAFPLEADAAWIALGWAAEAAVLWWFGQRINSPALRLMGAVLGVWAAARVIIVDLPSPGREPFVPVFNEYALPALGVVVCLLASLAWTRRLVARRHGAERFLVALAGAAVVLVLWLVLSIDCFGYFRAIALLPWTDSAHWNWLGQMSLSILWAVFATVLLAVGFFIRRGGLRWLAMGLYGVTALKVVLVDTEELDEIYRILVFFVLAVLMGAAAWAYQRFKVERAPADAAERAEGGEDASG